MKYNTYMDAYIYVYTTLTYIHVSMSTLKQYKPEQPCELERLGTYIAARIRGVFVLLLNFSRCSIRCLTHVWSIKYRLITKLIT